MPLDPLAALYVHMQYANFGHNTAKGLPMTHGPTRQHRFIQKVEQHFYMLPRIIILMCTTDV